MLLSLCTKSNTSRGHCQHPIRKPSREMRQYQALITKRVKSGSTILETCFTANHFFTKAQYYPQYLKFHSSQRLQLYCQLMHIRTLANVFYYNCKAGAMWMSGRRTISVCTTFKVSGNPQDKIVNVIVPCTFNYFRNKDMFLVFNFQSSVFSFHINISFMFIYIHVACPSGITFFQGLFWPSSHPPPWGFQSYVPGEF